MKTSPKLYHDRYLLVTKGTIHPLISWEVPVIETMCLELLRPYYNIKSQKEAILHSVTCLFELKCTFESLFSASPSLCLTENASIRSDDWMLSNNIRQQRVVPITCAACWKKELLSFAKCEIPCFTIKLPQNLVIWEKNLMVFFENKLYKRLFQQADALMSTLIVLLTDHH